MQHKMNSVNLAADYGWGPNHLLYLLIIVIIVGAAGFLIVMLTSRMKKQTFTSKKKYHFERYCISNTSDCTAEPERPPTTSTT